jgi:hypothetical protein
VTQTEGEKVYSSNTMEAVQRKIDEVKEILKDAVDRGLPIEYLASLNQRLAALTADLTELRRQGKPFISHRN